MAYLLAALGGALGALARWGVSVALPRASGDWPWATLTVNLLGCLLIGVLLGVLGERRPHDDHLRTFLGAGVLGGFTTFSTYAVEVRGLAGPRPGVALAYAMGTPALAVVAVAAGAFVTRAVLARG